MRSVLFIFIVLGVATGVGILEAQDRPTLPPRAALPPDLTGARPSPVPGGFGYPTLDVDREGILDLLRARRFRALDRLFTSLEDLTARDIRMEDQLVASYSAFFGSDESIAPRLDEWVASDPESDAALVARAQFLRARYWQVRGEDTLPGFDDASRAVGLDPQNLAAHSTLLNVVIPGGWTETSEIVLDSALTRFPTSHRIRYLALRGMSPRRGGTYDRMRRLVSEAQLHARANRRLRTLRGALALDRANELRLERRYAESLRVLEAAREYGTDWEFYYWRGRTFYHAADYVRALAQLDSAVALRPVSPIVLQYRGRALGRIAERIAPPERRATFFEYAEVDLTEAVAFSLPDSALAERLAWVSGRRLACAESAADCIEARVSTPSEARLASPTAEDMVNWEPEHWWQRLVLFLVSLPLSLYLVLVEGNRLFLLPAPFLAGLAFLWSFREWRRQRYWTPRLVHVMSVLAFATIVMINVDWVLAGGAMWTQRYVIIALFPLVPYVIYLVMLGPRHMGRRRPMPPMGPDQDQPVWSDGPEGR